MRLGRPELAPVVDELARRFSNGEIPVSLTLDDLPDPARQAIADLLGAERLPGRRSRLPIARILTSLHLASVEDLRRVVVELRGPLPDRRAARRTAVATRAALWAWVSHEVARLSVASDPDVLLPWVESLQARGIRGGVGVYRERLERVLAVLRKLPADDVGLAALGTDCTGDPHALDYGRAVGTLILDALARAADLPRPHDAETARLLWERFGVVPDALSSTVLAIGLPGHGGSPLAHWLAAAAAAGEPVVLTLANLRRWPVAPLGPDERVYVVENPSVVAEAAARGWFGLPPLVCSSGRPTVAVVTLLRQLTVGGAIAYQHADFDATGIGITTWLTQRAKTVPWLMDAGSYVAAVRGRSERGSEMTGKIPPTPWSPELHDALEQARVPVYEEEIRDALLAAMI